MVKYEYLMVRWEFVAIGKNLTIIYPNGEQESIKISFAGTGEVEFLKAINKFAAQGWELIDTSTIPKGSYFSIYAHMHRKIEN